jgi:hypothetical protein
MNDDGWTVDSRLDSEQYISSTDYTRTSDLHLDTDDLARAIAMADNF